MRRVAATLTLTASVALGALAPANAYEKTIHVGHFCDVTISTWDHALSWTEHIENMEYHRTGDNGVRQDCVTRPW